MPYFYDQNLEDEKQQQNEGQSNADSSGVQISSGGSSTPSGSSSSNGSSSQGSKPLQTGSGFQNLDSYFNANQGNQLANQFTGNIQGKINQASNQTKQDLSNFENEVDTANPVPSQSDIQNVVASGKPTSLGGSGESTQSYTPTQVQSWLNPTYQGPKTTAEDTNFSTNNFANEASQEANQAQSASGQYALLNQYFGNGNNYTTGEKNLDQALLQNTPGFGENLINLSNQASNLGNQLSSAQAAGNQYVSAKQQAQQNASNQLKSELGLDANGQVIQGTGAGELGQDYQTIENRFNQEAAAQTATQNQLAKDLASGNLSPSDLQALGLNSSDLIFDKSINPTFAAPLTLDQTISPEEYNYLNNLAALAGVQPLFGSLNPTPTPSNVNFDPTQYRNQVQNLGSDLINTHGAALDNLTPDQGNVVDWANTLNDVSGNNVTNIPSLLKALPSYMDNLYANYQQQQAQGKDASSWWNNWLNQYNSLMRSLKNLYGYQGTPYVPNGSYGAIKPTIGAKL